MPTPAFPVTVLQSSLKLTSEPPTGLKAKVGRSYIDMTVAELEGCQQPTAYKNLLFGLSFFHAVIQERLKVRINGASAHARVPSESAHAHAHAHTELAESTEWTARQLRPFEGAIARMRDELAKPQGKRKMTPTRTDARGPSSRRVMEGPGGGSSSRRGIEQEGPGGGSSRVVEQDDGSPAKKRKGKRGRSAGDDGGSNSAQFDLFEEQ